MYKMSETKEISREPGEKLVQSCKNVCRLLGNEGIDESRVGVFSDVKEEEGGAVYYCGLGEECIMAHYCQRLNEIAQMAYAAKKNAGRSSTPIDLMRF